MYKLDFTKIENFLPTKGHQRNRQATTGNTFTQYTSGKDLVPRKSGESVQFQQ